MSKYIIFFKFINNMQEAEREMISNLIKEKFKDTSLDPVCFFGDLDIKIFNQETGEVTEI